MSLDDGLSKFLVSLYDAVHDPDAWRRAMAEVIRRSDSRMLVATTADLGRKDVVDICFHGPDDSAAETGMREYVTEMSGLDPVFDWLQAHPRAAFCESTATVPAPDYQTHEFVKWTRSRFGASLWDVFYSEPVDGLSFVVSYFAQPGAWRPTTRQLALHSLFFENMERAVRLAVRPPNFAADDSALIAIDASGRALSLSPRAEQLLAEGDDLVIRDRLLTAQSGETAARLRRAIHAALDPGSGAPIGRSIRIVRNGGRSDLFVVVSPFPSSLGHVPRPAPQALVRIVEIDKGPERLGAHSHLFGLSRREIEIASALLEGHSIESLAASLGLSRNTVRNHLQSLFRKTGTSRQADLVRILDRVARQ